MNVYECIYIHIYINANIYMNAYIYNIYMCVCVCVCVCVCMCAESILQKMFVFPCSFWFAFIFLLRKCL